MNLRKRILAKTLAWRRKAKTWLWLKTFVLVGLLCTVATATEPPKYQPTFGLGDEPQQQVCENGVCYYPAQITNNNFGLGSRVIANRSIRRRIQPQQVVFGLPVQTTYVEPVTTTVAQPVVQYSAPVVVSPPVVQTTTYQEPAPIVTETVVYPTATYEVQSCSMCGGVQTTGTQPMAFRQQVRQRRYTRRQAWANRPGVFGWRMRAGLCR